MNRKLRKLAATAVLAISMMFFPVAANAAGDISPQQFVKNVSSAYTSWNTADIDGKVKLQGVPLRLSVKINMAKDKYVYAVIRAPFLGEIASAYISGQELTLMNKTNKTYCRKSLKDVGLELPFTVSDVQDILLARVFVAGSGTLSPANSGMCDIVEYDDENWYIIPKEELGDTGISYGFNLSPDGKIRLLYAAGDGENTAISAEYRYNKKNTEVDLLLGFGKKELELNVTLNTPDYKARQVKAPDLSKYKVASLKEVLVFL